MSRFHTIEISDPRFEEEHLREVTFKSPSLGRRADMTLFVPPGLESGEQVPLIILLHGVYGSHWAWTRSGGAHLTATRLIDGGELSPMVIAMPSDGLWGDGSAYLRHAGGDFERYIIDEVPAAAAEVVPGVAGSPQFIAGLSMGGFGALRLGGKFARRFSGISAHSSCTHFSQMFDFIQETPADYGPVAAEEQSALHWLTTNRDQLPPLRFDCGVDDQFIEQNRQLQAELTDAKVPHKFEEFPGRHEWPYWETHLADTLKFFNSCPLRRPVD